MKKLLVIFLLSLISNISSAQSGWGYVNYTSYKTHNGNGDQSQYPAFANVGSDFDVMFNTSNTNTTIFRTGEVTLQAMASGSSNVPKWNGDFFGYKFEFWFVPQETGTYRFGINSDDASDLSINGTIISTYYGGHGAGGYQIGTINLVAGTQYKVVARMQEFGGGEAFYLNWSKPSSPNTYSYWANEVTNKVAEPTKKAIVNFDFGTTIDKTKFSIGTTLLSSVGKIDITNNLDTNKVNTGYKSLTTAGQVEWCVVYDYDAANGRYRVGIDNRQMTVSAKDVNKLKLFDLWDGVVTYNSSDAYWSEYWIYTPTQLNFNNSEYISYIRTGNGYHALTADFTFTPTTSYKPQSITLSTTNNLSTLYNSIVTVSDVWLAFKEVSNTGIFGNESGKEFTQGIQYKNADVNEDGYFNEADCFALLQQLTGKKNIVDTFKLVNTLKLISTEKYNNITKSNWNSSQSYLGDVYSFDINTGKSIDTLNVSATWKGDVNLSHSAIPVVNTLNANGVRAMAIKSMAISNDVEASILTELKDGKFSAYITFNPLQQQVAGTQFQLNYDNSILKFEGVQFKTKGNPMNYGVDRGSYVNVGSLSMDGTTLLDNTTEYKVTFTLTKIITNGLGLIAIIPTDAVNNVGKQLNIKIN